MSEHDESAVPPPEGFDGPAPEGMYPDPERQGHDRHWDGAAWSAPNVGAEMREHLVVVEPTKVRLAREARIVGLVVVTIAAIGALIAVFLT